MGLRTRPPGAVPGAGAPEPAAPRARRERRVRGGRILLLRVDPVSETAALVHVLASEQRGDGAVAREVKALDTTLRTDDGWRVAVAR